MSGYSVTAQFYDAIAGDQHAAIDAQIAAALRGLDTQPGPVVDIGAGSGLTTRLIAATLPDAEVFAVEPHAAMRAALMTRVWSDPDLRRRVSILPGSIFDAPLPATISGAVASAALVHFDAEERRKLWALLAGRLAPAGRVIVEIQCPEAIDLAERQVVISRVGRIDYEGYAQARAVSPETQLWQVRYRSLLGQVEIDHQSAEFVCHAASADQVAAEAASHGFAAEVSSAVVLLTL